MKRRVLEFIACGAVFAALTIVAPQQSAAVPGDTVGLAREDYLTRWPRFDMSPICLSRHIRLRSGDYDWVSFNLGYIIDYDEVVHYGRIYLGGDVYDWQTCIYPQNGTYFRTNYLRALNHPSWHAIRNNYVEDKLPEGGQYLWGAKLDPLSF